MAGDPFRPLITPSATSLGGAAYIYDGSGGGAMLAAAMGAVPKPPGQDGRGIPMPIPAAPRVVNSNQALPRQQIPEPHANVSGGSNPSVTDVSDSLSVQRIVRNRFATGMAAMSTSAKKRLLALDLKGLCQKAVRSGNVARLASVIMDTASDLLEKNPSLVALLRSRMGGGDGVLSAMVASGAAAYDPAIGAFVPPQLGSAPGQNFVDDRVLKEIVDGVGGAFFTDEGLDRFCKRMCEIARQQYVSMNCRGSYNEYQECLDTAYGKWVDCVRDCVGDDPPGGPGGDPVPVPVPDPAPSPAPNRNPQDPAPDRSPQDPPPEPPFGPRWDPLWTQKLLGGLTIFIFLLAAAAVVVASSPITGPKTLGGALVVGLLAWLFGSSDAEAGTGEGSHGGGGATSPSADGRGNGNDWYPGAKGINPITGEHYAE